MSEQDFLRAIRALPCLACGSRWQIEAHHIVKRSNGGGNAWWNVIPLCGLHHTGGGVGVAWHQGPQTFLAKFPHVKDHLGKLGWEFLPFGKMHHPERNK